MKTIILSLESLTHSSFAHIVFRTYVTPLLFALTALTSCSKDDEVDNNADIAKIVGTYSVVDTDEDGEVENYSITISKSTDGGVEVSNFGDIMYVPVKATINGNTFIVPSQTFKGKSMTIIVTGNGSLNGDKLNFDYTIETDDDYLLEHSCVATKNG
jgi:hypothetical protein